MEFRNLKYRKVTLKQFCEQHPEIDVLELYDTSGNEIDDPEDPRWENCRVTAYSQDAGFFDVEIDPVIPAKI